MTYIWASVGLQVAFNEFFLVYVALFGLSLFTLVGGLVTSDADAVRPDWGLSDSMGKLGRIFF